MKRASYRAAVEWIALNDNAGTDTPDMPDAQDSVSGYVSTLLISDLFDVKPDRIAADVMRMRRKQ